MKALIITEKCNPCTTQRDGGARVVETLKKALGSELQIMQFGLEETKESNFHYEYRVSSSNRFERRIRNATFIGEKVAEIAQDFTDLIFIHISMQFGLISHPPPEKCSIWTFPMFLTPSYEASGETIPRSYFQMEKNAFEYSDHILTPSYYEKRQLLTTYQLSYKRISVVPRGVDTKYLTPKNRTCKESIHFCSVGSIKPQKNTLGLIKLFKCLSEKYPSSTLSLIGPVQNSQYGKQVTEAISLLKLAGQVHLFGHIPPSKLSKALEPAHIHLSTAMCETFGRSIFETLSVGIPNVVLKKDNASFDFLSQLPYIRYAENLSDAEEKVDILLKDYSLLSQMAQEIRILYDDQFLSNLLSAKILAKESIVISDYDGTLFHKGNSHKTERSIAIFNEYGVKILCSARYPTELLEESQTRGIKVDWIIGSSGGIVMDQKGNILWTNPLSKKDLSLIPYYEKAHFYRGEDIIQVSAPKKRLNEIIGLRREVYEDTAFIGHWRASKLHAILCLLKSIGWNGQVKVFGDGPYDQEMITYFDGAMITDSPQTILEQKELSYEPVLL